MELGRKIFHKLKTSIHFLNTEAGGNMLKDETEQRKPKLKCKYEGNFRESGCQSSQQNATECLGIGLVAPFPHRQIKRNQDFIPGRERGKITGDSFLKEMNKLVEEGFYFSVSVALRVNLCLFWHLVGGDETECLTKDWFPMCIS